MIVEEVIYEDDKIRIYSEVNDPTKKEESRCVCGHAVCCGKHKGCAKKKNNARVRFKSRTTW